MRHACKTRIDEKDQAYSGTAIYVQVVQARDCPQCGGGLPTIYASQKRENLIDFKFLFDLGFA